MSFLLALAKVVTFRTVAGCDFQILGTEEIALRSVKRGANLSIAKPGSEKKRVGRGGMESRCPGSLADRS